MTFKDLRETAFMDISGLTDVQTVRHAANRVIRQINEKFDGLLTTETVLTKRTDTAELAVTMNANKTITNSTTTNWTTAGITAGDVIFFPSASTNTGTYTVSTITTVSTTDDTITVSETLAAEVIATVVESWLITSGYTLDFAARTILLPDKIKKVVEIQHNNLEVDPVDHEKIYKASSDALDLYSWLDDNKIRLAADILGTAADVLKIQGWFRMTEIAAFDDTSATSGLLEATDLGIPTSMDEILYAGTKAFILALPKYFNKEQLAIETTIFQESLEALIMNEADKREAPQRVRNYDYNGQNRYQDN